MQHSNYKFKTSIYIYIIYTYVLYINIYYIMYTHTNAVYKTLSFFLFCGRYTVNLGASQKLLAWHACTELLRTAYPRHDMGCEVSM